MLRVNASGNIIINKKAKGLKEVKALYEHHDRKWVKDVLKFAYFMWSEEDIYGNMIYSRKAGRVKRDYVPDIDLEEVLADKDYKAFEDLYIETVYNPVWVTYIAWQQDADEYIKILKSTKLTKKNLEDKFQMLKRAKELLSLGNEFKLLVSGQKKFNDNLNAETKLFEEP